MSKTTETKAIAPHEAQDAFNDLITTGHSKLTYEEAFDALDETESGLVDLTQDYFTFDKPGQEISFVVEGFDMVMLAGKQVEVVKLRNREGQALINGDKVLVSSCKRLTRLPAWVKVCYKNDTKNAAGTYKNLIVRTFAV
jgi:hypothetical protein